MTVLALAALSLAHAGGQTGAMPSPGHVALSTGLLPAEQAIAEVARATGLDLHTTPSTANLPLLVRVRDADPQLLLNQIAAILGAEWKTSGTGFSLSCDSAHRRSIARRPDKRRETRIGAKLAEMDARTRNLSFDDAFAVRARKDGERLMAQMMKSSESGEGFDPTSMLSSALVVETPGSRAATALLTGLGAKRLAALVPGERVVYALRPTRMQGALPPGSLRALEAFLRGNAAYAQSLKNSAAGEEFDTFSMITGMGSPPGGGGPISDAHLELWVGDGMITAGLTVFDASGRSLGQGFALYDLSAPASAMTKGGEPLVVSDLGREWGAKLAAATAANPDPRSGPMSASGMFGARGGTALNGPLTPSLRAFLGDPVKNSLGGPLFDPVAAAIPGDLIATVPDSGLALLGAIVADPKTTGAGAIALLDASSQFSILRDGTMTLVGAATPAILHREFADRIALKGLVASIARTGYLRLDDAARFAVTQREAAGSANLAAPIATLLQGRAPFAFSGNPLTSEFETLRVYGSLSAAQRGTLAKGGSVSFASLGPGAADALERLLYDSPMGPYAVPQEVSSPDESPADPESSSEDPEESAGEAVANAANAAANAAAEGAGEVRSEIPLVDTNARAAERTVRFGDGMPRLGNLTMTLGKVDSYRMTDSSTGTSMFGDAGTLGMVRGARGLPYLRNLITMGEYDRFTPAQSLSYGLVFEFAPRVLFSRSLEDFELTSNATLSYAQLPEEFRQTVEQTAQSAASMRPPERVAAP